MGSNRKRCSTNGDEAWNLGTDGGDNSRLQNTEQWTQSRNPVMFPEHFKFIACIFSEVSEETSGTGGKCQHVHLKL
jgi:hypothetical protein